MKRTVGAAIELRLKGNWRKKDDKSEIMLGRRKKNIRLTIESRDRFGKVERAATKDTLNALNKLRHSRIGSPTGSATSQVSLERTCLHIFSFEGDL
jgi:hypothetical protein